MPKPVPNPDDYDPDGLYDLPRIACFKPGVWNGRKWDAAYINRMRDTFKKFSDGPNPYHRAYLSVNHDKFPEWNGLRFGQLANATVDRAGVLWFDAIDVPGAIAKLVRMGALKEPSLEFVEPRRAPNGTPVSGFSDAAGRIVDGPVIKCLTLIGNDMPGVKGLPPLPAPVPAGAVNRFAFVGGVFHRFAGSLMQTRDQMIAALQAMGFDTTTLTDAVPDEFLAAILAYVQGKNANPNPAGDTANPNPANNVTPQQMADLTAGTGLSLPTPSATGGAPTPSQVVLKFNQQFPGLIGGLTGALTALRQQSAAVERIQTKTLDDAKKAVVDQLFRETGLDGGTGQITPAMQPAIRILLMKCDHIQTRKFADGKADGTELEEAVKTIRDTYPVQRRPSGGGPSLPQPAVPGAANNGASGGGGMTPERRARILGGSPIGQTVLGKKK